MPWQRRLKRPRRAMSHHLGWFVEGTTILEKWKKHMESEHFLNRRRIQELKLMKLVLAAQVGLVFNYFMRTKWYYISLLSTSIPGCVSSCQNSKPDIRCFFGHLEFYSAGSFSLTKWPQNISGLSLQKIYPSQTVPTNSLNSPKLMNHTGPLAMFWQIYKNLLLGNQHLVYRWWGIHLELG